MTIESQFPLREWIRVTGITIYAGGRDTELATVMAHYRTVYGERFAAYLGLLSRTPGSEFGSVRELRPFFRKSRSIGSSTSFHEVYEIPGNSSKMIVEAGSGYLKIQVDTGNKKGLRGFIGMHDAVHVAELRYETVKAQGKK